jgi:hypothetical protein
VTDPPALDYPRVNKARNRVVCEAFLCRGTVGLLEDHRVPQPHRRLMLPSTFELGADGIWHPSKYADWRRRNHIEPLPRHQPAYARGPGRVHVNLPAKVECPECGQIRPLDADRLQVSPPTT